MEIEKGAIHFQMDSRVSFLHTPQSSWQSSPIPPPPLLSILSWPQQQFYKFQVNFKRERKKEKEREKRFNSFLFSEKILQK